MSQSRQLVAIMFTDIVGYTILMGKDEQKAFDILNKNRQLQKPLIEQYGGKWIKEMGDGVLATFSTVTDAVRCACEIIKACEKEDGLQLRIGIHHGEVVFANGDVFGDGVNIASRIQSIAPINGIYITEAVYNNIVNKLGFHSSFAKEETLKHVKEPVRLYTVTAEQKTKLIQDNSSPDNTKETQRKTVAKSIAVLPFVNMSNDPEQEYFSDGVSEEILISLSNLKDLKVAGRTSSFQFKGKNIDLRKVGEQLSVNTVLEGSVRKQGNHLRITAQLINVEDGFHLWSEKYDREMNDIFAIQDEIALAITEKLKITLLHPEKPSIIPPTESTDAYHLYLKGRFFWYKRGVYLKKSLELFQQAIELDPNFGLAYAGMADAYSLMSLYHIEFKPHDAMPKARQAAEKAIKLNPMLVEAHTSLAIVTAYYDWNWLEAPKQFQRAIQLNGNYAPVRIWHSLYLAWAEGKYDEAINEARKAIELEPLLSASYHYLAVCYIAAKRFEAASEASRTAIELDSNSFYSYRTLGVSLLYLNNFREGIEALETAVSLSNRGLWALSELSAGYALIGKKQEAEKLYYELQEVSNNKVTSPLLIGLAAYAAGHHDDAVGLLEKAYKEREPMLMTIRFASWPTIIPLANEKWLKDIILNMNFPMSLNNI